MKYFTYLAILMLSAVVVVVSFQQNATQIENAQVLAATTSVPSNPLLSEINDYRKQAGLQVLLPSNANQTIADIRATKIADSASYSHTRPGGGIFSDLYEELPAQSCENLQLQQTASIEAAVQAWIDSADHRKCLLHERSRYAGIAIQKMSFKTGEPSFVIAYIGSSN